MKYIDSKKVLIITGVLIFLFPAVTYLLALFFREYDILPQVGSVDTWISFAGTIFGGSLTMTALYFTLRYEQDLRENIRQESFRPYIFCEFNDYNECTGEIFAGECILEYGFIKWSMVNSTNNVANDIRIVNQRSFPANANTTIDATDVLLDEYGISTYTVIMNESISLPPHCTRGFNTNICIEVDEGGEFKFGTAFAYRHIIEYEYKSIFDGPIYNGKFEFEINVNATNEGGVILFLEEYSNSMPPSKIG